MSKTLSQFSLSKALRFRIGNEGKLYGSISHSSGEFYVAPEVLGILCQLEQRQGAFDSRVLLKNLHADYTYTLKNLPVAHECEEIIADLCAAGLLVKEGTQTDRALQQDGFGDDWIQWAMLADTPRCLAYENALLESVNEQSTVADIGAGTGLLSALALKAGAKKVVAVEETHMAKNIASLLKAVNLPRGAQTFNVINKNSFDAVLPINTTHIVSELFGNDPLSEGVVSTLRNIGERFQKQPQYIPLKVAVYFEVVDILEHPVKHRLESVFARHKKVSSQHANSITSEFVQAALSKFNFNDISFPLALHKNDFARMSASVSLGELPLNPPKNYPNNKMHPLLGDKSLPITQKGACPVGLLWFRVTLTPTVTLSSHPHEADCCEHWSPILVLLEKHVTSGDNLNIHHRVNELETQINCDVLLKKTRIGGRG